MIKCTGERCQKTDKCWRYAADAVLLPHFEGMPEEGECKRHIPHPETQADDDKAIVMPAD